MAGKNTKRVIAVIINTELDTIVEPRHECEIMAAWHDRLEALWGDGTRLGLHRQAVAEMHDAYRYLLARIVLGRGEATDRIIAQTIDRVQTEDFNIADLFSEIRCLHELLENPAGERPGDIVAMREMLDDFFAIVAHETSVIYESFAERGSQGLVFLDGDGKITYANRSALTMLGESGLRQERFAARLLAGDRQALEAAMSALQDDPGSSPLHLTIRHLDENGKRRNLALEIAYLGAAPSRSVYYLSLAPIKLLGIEDDVLERFDHGVVRVDSSKQVCYANRAAKKIIGVKHDDLLPVHVHEFFVDPNDRHKINEELEKRESGELSRYEINVTRPCGRKLPISVFAIPEMNARGDHVGSVAFMRNLEVERAQADFNRILLHSPLWKDRLEELSRWLFERIGADIIYIYQYTDNLSHTSPIASLENNGEEFKSARRWYELTPGLIQWNQEPGVKLCGDLPEFLEQDFAAYLKEDPTVDGLVNQRGIRSFMATPVLEDGSCKAGISFLSVQPDKFTEEDAELIDRLPLRDFVMSALQRKEHEEKVFQFRLMAELSKCDTFVEIAEKVTTELAHQYKWDNVSIFDVAEDLNKTLLLHQTPGSDLGYVLPQDFDQPVTRGVLGRAFRKQARVYVPDVEKDADFVRGHEQTRSELVIPIFSKLYEPRRVFWLLNIEDSFAEFLLPSEIAELEEIADHIEFIVNRMIDRETYEKAMKHTSDGVIVTDANGAIRCANPASVKLLECEEESRLIGKQIEELFCDSQMAQNFKAGILSDSHKVDLFRAGEKSPITVLLSRLELQSDISDRYYIFKTLETQKHLADLDAVERLVSVTANQVKTPLSLVQGMLHRLSHGKRVLDQARLDEFIERSRHLLRKAELSYDRVAYSEPIDSREHRIETYIHVDRLLEKINREVSGDCVDVLRVKVVDTEKPVAGDRHQVRFVFESLVSYLLRNLATEERIDVVLDYADGWLDVEIEATADRQMLHDEEADLKDWDRVVSEAAYGESAIRRIVEQHGGEFCEPIFDSESGEMRFRLGFPTNEYRREQTDGKDTHIDA